MTSSKIFAVTNYVSKSGGHVSPFTSWANAATNIQAAVDVAVPNDIVLVTNGIYDTGERVTPGYSCSNRVVITNDIIVKSVNGPENTIILGKGPLGSNAVRCVYMSAGILEGFTVSNGFTMTSGDSWGDQSGGGVNVYDGNGVVTNCTISGNSANSTGGGTAWGIVNNCTISRNSANNYGGGTYEGTVNNCIIKGNSANRGGGTSYCSVNNCTISCNSSVDDGGGTYQGTINSCIIIGNLSKYGGGACYSTVNNCTISGNSAEYYGGGIYSSTINNCIIIGNTAVDKGGGTCRSTVNNCIIIDNSASVGSNFQDDTINYSCTYPLSDGVGNFTNNPILLSASHISPFSPCIGAGNNLAATGTDIDGETWENPPSVGCDEVYINNLTGDLLVNIYAEYTSAVVGSTLEFRAIITGKPVSNYWTFNDGTSVENSYITDHSFDVAGEYQVILSAFNIDNPAGVSATVTVNIVELNNATYYVNKANTTSVYPYNSWSAAASNIQDAVDAAMQMDVKHWQVLVTNGIYDTGETVTPEYSSSNRVVISEDIIVKSVNGPESTVIVGKGPSGESAVRGVYMSAGILDGFTVSNGYTFPSGDFFYDRNGGGINMRGGNGIVTNCFIFNNLASSKGAGVYYGNVNNCFISKNYAGNDGGGTYECVVNNCIINKNSAGDDGGGTYNGTVNNCIISSNSVESAGGGTCYGTINNCTISGNSAATGGGASYNTVNNCIVIANVASSGGGTYKSAVNNCTISANYAENDGGGTKYGTVNNCNITWNTARDDGGGSYFGTINNSIVWYNLASDGSNIYKGSGDISYSCTYPTIPGVGNFTNNPVLLSASHISPFSPCIGAGNNLAATGTDIDGETWENPPSVGCDEVYINNLTGDLLVNIYAEYTSAVVGSTLEFRAIITGKPVSNYWTFNDGTSVENSYITDHSFDVAGEYQVILSAFNIDNPAGVSATVTVNIVELNNATYYVDKASTTPMFPYRSWSTAATSIQDAVDIASQIKHSLLLVTNGIYDTGGKITPGYSCFNRVVVTEDITLKSVNGPGNTIIQGQGPLGNNAIRGVYMSAGVLEGFKISNGHTMYSGNKYYDLSGGGINMYNGYGIVTNCIISGNSARESGGGCYWGMINNCNVSRNSADENGGGVTGCLVNNCTISENTSRFDGGGAAGCTINNCTIIDNSSNSDGGGLSGCKVNNCMISENTAKQNGGGIYSSTINNCIISKNMANTGGGTFYGTVNNCIVWDNSASASNNFYRSIISYSCSYPLPSGVGNISNNPQFISASDFHLQMTSPCIDAGTNAFAPMPWDLDGNPRIIDGTVDMGCYEFVPEGGIILLMLSASFIVILLRRH